MGTVVEGVGAGQGAGTDEALTEHGAEAFNEALLAAMTARFPGRSWHVVPMGPDNPEWHALVAGCGYTLPTDEENEYAYLVRGGLWLTEDPTWWEASR